MRSFQFGPLFSQSVPICCCLIASPRRGQLPLLPEKCWVSLNKENRQDAIDWKEGGGLRQGVEMRDAPQRQRWDRTRRGSNLRWCITHANTTFFPLQNLHIFANTTHNTASNGMNSAIYCPLKRDVSDFLVAVFPFINATFPLDLKN